MVNWTMTTMHVFNQFITGMNGFVDLLQKPMSELLTDTPLPDFFEGGFLNRLLEWIIHYSFEVTPMGDVPLFFFMFGVGVPFYVAYQVYTWVGNIWIG